MRVLSRALYQGYNDAGVHPAVWCTCAYAYYVSQRYLRNMTVPRVLSYLRDSTF